MSSKLPSSLHSLSELARIEILKMTNRAGASHVGSALSVVDILAVLYGNVANASPSRISDPDRDIIILSKGHAATALYSILAIQGFFPLSWLHDYCSDGAQLGGHVTSKGVPGVELSTGSLGHGFPYGLGIALSQKRSKKLSKVFVVMSDGECDEGTTWESAMIASHLELGNLVVIVDRNYIQSLGSTEETLTLEPFADKWRAFGWNVHEVEGHDFEQLESALQQTSTKIPTCVIANTTKGKGVSFMENSVAWHYKSPNQTELQHALSEISRGQNA
jgi:transketolase